ncbi:MAG: cation transporter [Chlamydiae bacterium]|nr:cation transporter [Chlamydiota bacterium]MBI3266563.1 cation transporter [Chlamydiota bacterium]
MNHSQNPTQEIPDYKPKSLGWAIGLSMVLSLMKGVVGLFSSSAALIASSVDSLMDVGISSVNYFSLRKAAKPPDSDHAYGHGKIESLASYTQGVLFILLAFFILIESVRRAQAHTPLTNSGGVLFTIVLASLVNLFITFMLYRAEKKTGSLILKAEGVHYFMDILSYALIFVSILLVRWTGWRGWDIVGGILVALYVAGLAAQILFQAGNELVDRSLPTSTLDELDKLIRRHDPRILDYHELRTRKVGSKHFIDFHLVLKSNQSFEKVHEISESLIEKIKEKFQDADVTVHEDPEGGI